MIKKWPSPSYSTVISGVPTSSREIFRSKIQNGLRGHQHCQTPEIDIDLILDEWWILAKRIAKTLEIPRNGNEFRIHEQLGTQKLSVKMVSKYLNTKQNCNCLQHFGMTWHYWCNMVTWLWCKVQITVHAVAPFGLSTANEIQDPKISREGHSHFVGYKEGILMAISRNTKQLMENISFYVN